MVNLVQCSLVQYNLYGAVWWFSAVRSCVQCCVVGLALIGALTWSQPDRDLKGGQSGNPFQIGSFFLFTFNLGVELLIPYLVLRNLIKLHKITNIWLSNYNSCA